MKPIKFATLFLALYIFGCQKPANDPGNNGTVPTAPSQLTVTGTGPSQISLNWTDNATNESGFKLERKSSGTPYAIIATLSKDITSYTDQGLMPVTSYTYRVSAFNDRGPSTTYSNEVIGTTSGLPVIKTSAITDTTGVSVRTGGNISDDGGSAITERGVVWSTGAAPTIALSTKSSNGSGTGSFGIEINGLVPGTTYHVRAYAINANGTGYGDEIVFSTNDIDIKNKLLLYYPFNGNAGDSSGNGINASVNGAVLAKDRYDKADQAYILNNTFMASGSIPLNLASDHSVSYWQKLNGFDEGHAVLELGEDNKCNGNPQLWQHEQRLYLATCSNAFNNIPVDTTSNLLNSWVHIAWVYSGGTTTLYVNGKKVGTGNMAWPPTSNTILTLGNAGNNGSPLHQFPSNVTIDEVRIHSRPLSANEVNYLYKH